MNKKRDASPISSSAKDKSFSHLHHADTYENRPRKWDPSPFKEGKSISKNSNKGSHKKGGFESPMNSAKPTKRPLLKKRSLNNVAIASTKALQEEYHLKVKVNTLQKSISSQ